MGQHRLDRWRLTGSLKGKLVLFFLLLDLSTLAVMTIGVGFDATDAMERQIRQRLEDKAHNVSQAITEDVRTKWEQMRAISQNTLIVNGIVDTLGRAAYLKPFVNKLSLPGRGKATPYIALLDYRGRLVTDNRSDHADSMQAPWVGSVLQGGQHVSVFADAQAGQSVRFAFPIFYHGQVEGILVSEFSLGLVDELAPADRVIATGIVAAGGHVLYGAIPAEITQAAARLEAADGVRFIEHGERLYSMIESPFPESLQALHWHLVLSVDKEAVSQPVRQLLWRMLAVALLSATAVTVLVFLRARQFVQPLTDLQATMQAIMDQGDLSKSVQIKSRDEVGALGGTFNQMMRKLQGQEKALREEVSERSRAETELRAANDALRQTVDELRATQAQLIQSEKMASLGQLAAGVAHEINNPVGFVKSNLRTLRGYSADLMVLVDRYERTLQTVPEGLDRHELDALLAAVDLDFLRGDLEQLLGESEEGLVRIAKIVADLKDFSHIDRPDVEDVDFNAMLDKVINVAWNELKYKAEIVREYGQLPPVRCYSGRIGQVILNLLVNAAQAIPERGQIKVRTEVEGSELVVTVADTGGGIDPEIMSKIFDPFFTTKPVGKGTGLGLHIVYKIVEAHGGCVKVASTVGEGTAFMIRLPLVGPPEPATAKLESVVENI